MKVDISPIKQTSGDSLPFSFTTTSAALDIADDGVSIASTISIRGEIINQLENYLARGVISLQVTGECARCLTECRADCEIKFEEVFTYEPSEENFVIRDNRADLTAAVYENILSGIPSKLLCREECSGLCPLCGADIDRDGCDCGSDRINPQFAELAKLLK